jgi:hypothetical protein
MGPCGVTGADFNAAFDAVFHARPYAPERVKDDVHYGVQYGTLPARAWIRPTVIATGTVFPCRRKPSIFAASSEPFRFCARRGSSAKSPNFSRVLVESLHARSAAGEPAKMKVARVPPGPCGGEPRATRWPHGVDRVVLTNNRVYDDDVRLARLLVADELLRGERGVAELRREARRLAPPPRHKIKEPWRAAGTRKATRGRLRRAKIVHDQTPKQPLAARRRRSNPKVRRHLRRLARARPAEEEEDLEAGDGGEVRRDVLEDGRQELVAATQW